MIDGYSLIILGLIADVIGAVLIVSPILSLRKMDQKELARIALEDTEANKYIKKTNRNRVLVWVGVGFLVGGFVSQIVGNYFQYLESLAYFLKLPLENHTIPAHVRIQLGFCSICRDEVNKNQLSRIPLKTLNYMACSECKSILVKTWRNSKFK